METMELKAVQAEHPQISPIQQKLRALAVEVAKLNAGPLRERVAVPSPNGGYVMVVREIKA